MGKNIRVLLAEDNSTVRERLRLSLEQAGGIEVVGEISNGLDVLEQASACRPEVVVMDIRMPLLDGLGATRQLKLRHPDIRVVILTIYGDLGHRIKAMEAGASVYLVKDVPLEQVIEAVRGEPVQG